MDIEIKTRKRKKKAQHLDLRSSVIPNPLHVLDIIWANCSPKKSVGDKNTSSMKVMAIGGGMTMGQHYE